MSSALLSTACSCALCWVCPCQFPGRCACLNRGRAHVLAGAAKSCSNTHAEMHLFAFS
ncbi:hypothetical protein IF2G_06199 [Cordyceps javanica]|nr:hypothetical protein IF2G_06199 [Cordyceps javanica]